jgi:uncharacterized membrane protein
MTPQTTGILVGGIIPAFGYSAFAIGTKFASQSGLGAGPLLVVVGLACALAGAGFWWALPAAFDARSLAWGAVSGLAWAVGTGFVSLALVRWGTPIAKLNPIYNTNTLITVVLGLVVFSEWKQVNPWQLVGGAVLILAGSLLVSGA